MPKTVLIGGIQKKPIKIEQDNYHFLFTNKHFRVEAHRNLNPHCGKFGWSASAILERPDSRRGPVFWIHLADSTEVQYELQDAVDEVMAKTLVIFKLLGEPLNYDVED